MKKSESKYFNTAVKMDLALISLLKEKSFSYITVSEICKKAEVNRSTFYLHYETVGDLLRETARYLLSDFFSYFSNDVKSISFNIMDCELNELMFICDKYLTPYLSYIRDHKEVFGTMLSHFHTLGLDDFYQKMFEQIFNPILDRFHYPNEDRKYVMTYYLNGINAIVLEWIKDDCKKKISDISKIISTCIYGLNHCLMS